MAYLKPSLPEKFLPHFFQKEGGVQGQSPAILNNTEDQKC